VTRINRAGRRGCNVDRWPVCNWVFSCLKSGKKAARATMKTNKDEVKDKSMLDQRQEEEKKLNTCL